MTKVVLTCDQCGKEETFRESRFLIIRAVAKGWRIERSLELPDLCPRCKEWSAYP